MTNQKNLLALSVAFAGLFSGGAIYINLVEHPARLQCDINEAHKQWAPSYKRAAFWQASLAFFGCLTSIINYTKNKNKLVLWGGLLLGSVIPFTFAAIMPTNKILLSKEIQLNDSQKLQLLEKWGTLHGVRTVASLISFGLLLYAWTKL